MPLSERTPENLPPLAFVVQKMILQPYRQRFAWKVIPLGRVILQGRTLILKATEKVYLPLSS